MACSNCSAQVLRAFLPENIVPLLRQPVRSHRVLIRYARSSRATYTTSSAPRRAPAADVVSRDPAADDYHLPFDTLSLKDPQESNSPFSNLQPNRPLRPWSNSSHEGFERRTATEEIRRDETEEMPFEFSGTGLGQRISTPPQNVLPAMDSRDVDARGVNEDTFQFLSEFVENGEEVAQDDKWVAQDDGFWDSLQKAQDQEPVEFMDAQQTEAVELETAPAVEAEAQEWASMREDEEGILEEVEEIEESQLSVVELKAQRVRVLAMKRADLRRQDHWQLDIPTAPLMQKATKSDKAYQAEAAPSTIKSLTKLKITRIQTETTSTVPNPRDPPQWLVEKLALKKKLKGEAWNPRKRLSPEALKGLRMLHQQYPEYSTPKLSQLFQISPEAIRKILSSNWQPTPEEDAERTERWKRRGDKVWDRWLDMGLVDTRQQKRKTQRERKDLAVGGRNDTGRSDDGRPRESSYKFSRRPADYNAHLFKEKRYDGEPDDFSEPGRFERSRRPGGYAQPGFFQYGKSPERKRLDLTSIGSMIL